MGYKLKLDLFEGPLDLLIYLIRKNDIEIKDIPIVEITDQYIKYIEMMKTLDLDAVGDFIVMAATLMQIKSKMLLPQDPNAEEEDEDPRDELVRRLEEYNRFKSVSSDFEERMKLCEEYFSRLPDYEEIKSYQEQGREVVFETTLFDLIDSLSHALRRLESIKDHEVLQDEFTVEQKIHDLLHLLIKKDEFVLNEILLQSRSKSEAIVTFLAILELSKVQEVRIMQKRAFAEIMIVKNHDKVSPFSVNEYE